MIILVRRTGSCRPPEDLHVAGDERRIALPSLRKKEATMRVSWVLVILLCRVPPASQSPASSSTKDQKLQILCTAAEIHEPVFVPCPNVTAVDAEFGFLEDKIEVFNDSSTTVSSGRREIKHCSSLKSELQLVRLCQDEVDNTVGFLFNVTAFKYEAAYTCEARITYPPPYRIISSDQRALFRVKGDHYLCHITKSNNEKKPEGSPGFLWIWIMAVVLLSTYGLALTITTLVFWAKLRRADSQNDYMNAKPIGPRKRRKKNGFKNPIPRYF